MVLNLVYLFAIFYNSITLSSFQFTLPSSSFIFISFKYLAHFQFLSLNSPIKKIKTFIKLEIKNVLLLNIETFINAHKFTEDVSFTTNQF